MEYKCRICNSLKNNKIYVVRELMLGSRDEFSYFQCLYCNCLQIVEFPNNVSKYYPAENYYSYNTKGDIEKKRFLKLKGKLVKANVFQGKHLLGKLIHNTKIAFVKGYINNYSDKILDVGCGDGRKFLDTLYSAGFTNAKGCDPFISKSFNYNNGLEISKKEIFDVTGIWNLICFNHSFEHIENPVETLQKVFDLLMHNGVCIIRIPTVSSLAWEKYRENWFQLDAPRHYFLHSKQSISSLAEKTGLTVERVVYDSTHHQFTISERYSAGKTFSERKYNNVIEQAAGVVEKFRNAQKAKLLNRNQRGDQAIFYLRKN